MQKSPLFIGGAFLAGLAAGAVAGAKLVHDKLAAEFEERLERETAQMRVFYTKVSKDKYPTPADAVADLIPEPVTEVLEEYQGKPKQNDAVAYNKIKTSNLPKSEAVEEPETLVNKNVFEKDDEEEIVFESITQEEFDSNESNYIQSILTWYAGDNILVDVRDDRIDDPKSVIGEATPSGFGENPDEPNLMHVRNNTLQIDFEIQKSNGYYAVEVLGEEPPLERPSQRIRQGG